MKNSKTLFIILLIALSGALFGQNKVSKADITVSEGTITINGVKLSSKDDCNISAFQSALGKASRTKDGYNRLHTYDDLGIVLFESTSTHLVNEIQVFTVADNTLDFCPKSLFSGTLKVEKLKVGTSTKQTKASKKLKKYNFKKSALDDNSYRGEYKYIYVFFSFNDSGAGVKKTSLGIKEK